jgi:hypothetical protein
MSDAIDYDHILDAHCVSNDHPWSVLDVSLPNAQLAGVFAGFMVLAITTLLARERPSDSGETRRGISHTLALFASGVIILALDAYMFGSIAASKPPEVPHSHTVKICHAAWLEFMPAAGMLALGATLLVAGIGWMLTQHAAENQESHVAENQESDKHLTTLGNILAGMVIAGTMALLVYDALIFLEEMQQEFRTQGIQTHSRGFVQLCGALFIAVPTAIIAQKSVGLWLRVKTKQDWDEVLDPRYTTIQAAAILAGIYLLVAVAFTWALPHWDHIMLFIIFGPRIEITPRDILWDSIALCLFVPGLINILIAQSLPGPYNCVQLLIRCRAIRGKFWRGKRESIQNVKVGDIFTEIVSQESYKVIDTRDNGDGRQKLELDPIGPKSHPQSQPTSTQFRDHDYQVIRRRHEPLVNNLGYSISNTNRDTGVVVGSVEVIDPNKRALIYSSPVESANGVTVLIRRDGTFSYTPTEALRFAAAAYNARPEAMRDKFKVAVGNRYGGSTEASVSVPILPGATPPWGAWLTSAH